MKATAFEYRHQTVLHVLLVGLALATYLIFPDDIVWALVRHHANNRLLERVAFGVGAVVVIGSAALETWATANGQVLRPRRAVLKPGGPYRIVRHPLRLARLLFALALGFLLSLPGTVVLIAGETILVLRLLCADQESVATQRSKQHPSMTPELSNVVSSLPGQPGTDRLWRRGFQTAASKWGLAASMILLALTLRDRVAEIAAGISFLVWVALNIRYFALHHGSD